MLSPLRVTYIFAGPRETVLHALIMKNYGCTHTLIGRDHAGIGDYYDKYASHMIFQEFTPEELGIDVRLYHEVFYCTRCDSLGTVQTCPHEKHFHINISGTSIREMLRHGILPPKEIIRPESARIAIQGIQPKGVDEHGESTLPVSKTIKSVFPYYLERMRLGGPKRSKPLSDEELTREDLEMANLDVRENAHKIYQGIFEEYSFLSDINRNLQPEWVMSARESAHEQQLKVIQDLETKVKQALLEASDEFMYQDKAEAERELEVAHRILEDIPSALRTDELKYRVWNPLPYDRYRGKDE